eukprot:maker-scaffold_69-snap-gene-0.49-mRNA-1 protein AED:0.46 eAED:0.71 QI:0/0/0/1/0/0/2/0/70
MLFADELTMSDPSYYFERILYNWNIENMCPIEKEERLQKLKLEAALANPEEFNRNMIKFRLAVRGQHIDI